MATKTLVVDLFGRDKTLGKAFKGAGDNAGRMGDAMRRAGGVAAAGLAVAGAAAVAFGAVSVKAFAEAQVQQERLNFAYERFNALQDTTRESYDALNRSLMLKTGFDDDAIASGQAILAQFGLTGTQLQKITPLLLDYARATGKDLTTSAEDFGKALLGQMRALKEIGLDFDDAGTLAGNFDQLMAGLASNVGGYAEEFGTTAAGKVEILTAKWGDFQEKVGSALLPGLVKIMDFVDSDVLPELQGFAEWFETNGADAFKGVVDGVKWIIENQAAAVLAIGAMTTAFWGMSAALSANPIGLVVLGLSAILGLAAVVAANWDAVTKFVFKATGGIVTGLLDIGIGAATGIQNVVNGMLAGFGAVIDVVNVLRGLVGLPGLVVPRSVDMLGGVTAFRNVYGNLLSAGQVGGMGGVNAAAAGGMGSGGAGGGSGPFAFAEGGLVKGGRGGVFGMIGEKNYDELVVPLKGGNSMFGGTTIVVHGYVGSEAQLGKVIDRVLTNSRKVGAIA